MDCRPSGSSVHEILHAEYWSGLPCPSPMNPRLLCILHWQVGSLPLAPPGKPIYDQFSHSVVSNSVTPWTAARQASLSITNSRSLLKLMSTESVMPSNYLILCCPLLLLPFTITLNKMNIEGMYLIIIKPIYDKPTVNLICDGKKPKTFLLISGTRQGCPL